MKHWIFTFALGALLPVHDFFAQNPIYSFPAFPVDIEYPVEWKFQQESKNAWLVSDGTTEFNIIAFKANKRFNADSLRYMAMKFYADPNIQNLQVSEVGSGSMGTIPAEKCVLSFMSQGKLYLSTMYLAKFHLNHQYNSLLFYFEIGEGNVKSYAPLQERMISSLKYRPFQYKSLQQQGVQFLFPNHWAGQRVEEGDSMLLKVTDGRAALSIFSVPAKDSLPVFQGVETYRDYLKKFPGDRTDLKVKTEKEKWGSSALALMDLRYQVNELGVLYRWVQKRRQVIQMQDDQRILYTVVFEYPEGVESFYAPVEKQLLESLKFPGTTEQK